jgi:succinate dehydrogenase/fumarate reductase flavoprotein subunit
MRLITGENTQVLDTSRNPIKGLYAVGNDAASVMGGNYPGAGITLGPALTFGYVAAMHLAKAGESIEVNLQVDRRESVAISRHG